MSHCGATTFNQCIFCRGDATNSRSVEHIIPESLGNIEHTLPPGIVCDRCNNNFARKIEGPLLETEYFRHLRSLMTIENKRGRIPPMSGFVPQLKMPVNVWMDPSAIFVEPKDSGRAGEFGRSMVERPQGTLFVPIPDKNEIVPQLMSRFIGKVAIEALALRVMQVQGWREELLSNESLDPLRRFVRMGEKPNQWQFCRRHLYRFDRRFRDKKGLLFFVMAIFGEEFAIDMGNPEIVSYEAYLRESEGVSPLYRIRHNN